MITWLQSLIKGRFLSIKGNVKVVKQIENGKKKADVCREFCIVNCTISTIWKSSSKIISVFEQNRSRIKQFRKPE